ncbi:LacI family transcriptional regulator [uncultured Cohaesibacter sp.]|uniref:LacI family transcriptional regulator n=1 Tax=uncultured Cohaesibacter sp. TaxID=1002546 RepID=UPI0029314DF4|nr:LacI family transcriptional regulator [uncultured Cohaesibacter sp.]
MSTKRPTLKTISELSGFAVTTVSRALNDGPEIGAETKEKVRKIAEEIGYVRNRSGLGLVTGRTNVITLILSADHDVIDDHTGRLISAIAHSLKGSPYYMNIVTFSSQEDRLQVVKHVVETGGTDAIILNQTEPEDERIAYLMARSFPFAAYGRTSWQDRHPYFDFDTEAYADLAVRRLLAKGRRQFLLVSPPITLSYSQHLLSGVKRARSEFDYELEVLEGVTSHDGSEALLAALLDRLKTDRSIDAIITPSTATAVLSLAAIEQSGRTLGGDIDVFAKEASPYLKLIRREILSVYQDLTLAGDFLARAAIQSIERPDEPMMQRIEKTSEQSPVGPF